MNFASLLRMHENRQPTNYYAGQYAINCNRKNDVNIVIGAGQNYHHSNKKRAIGIQPVQPINQSLNEIFANFEQNSHVQWILQLQSHKVKIHTFKPSKFKTKKQEPDHKQKFQPRLYPQQRQNIHPITPVTVPNEDDPSEFIPQDHQVRERKNYSPMRQMRQKKCEQDQNWRQNLNQNQNKFSFGDESDKKPALQQQIQQIPHQNVQNVSKNDDQSQLTLQNKSCIEERHQYEIHEERNCPVRGVNLMEKFEDHQNGEKIPQNIIQKEQIPQPNPIIKIESVKNLQQKFLPPNTAVDSNNHHVGFSFKEAEKADKNQETLTIDQLNIGQQSHQDEEQHVSGPPTERTQHSISKDQQQFEPVKPVEPQKKIAKQNSLTFIKTDVQIKDVEKKLSEIVPAVSHQTIANQNLRQKQSSPKRIYCKANVRTLTPQTIKYPSVQAKILQNNDIQPFSTENDTNKYNSEVNTKKPYESKVGNIENERGVLISNSERLLALIDESKRLLKSRTVGEEKKNEDRITRIVLHQTPSETKITLKETPVAIKENEPVKLQLRKNEKKPEEKQPEQKLPVIDIPLKALTPLQEETKNLTSQKLTPSKKDQPNPMSPLQLKTKFFNQLTNFETNYVSENSNLSPYIKNAQSAVAQNQIPQFVPSSVNVQSNNAKTAQVGQKSYQNYTYKPLSMPPLPKQPEQKDASVYKAPFYQPYTSPSQPISQVFQPTVQPYQQVNDPSMIQKAPIQPQVNVNFNISQVKNYSPYFTVNNTSTVKPSGVVPVPQSKPNQIYQTFTYSGFHSTQQNSSIRPLTPTQPGNYFKLNNASYVNPMEKIEKVEQREAYHTRINQDVSQKENVKPSGLGISGIRCIESKIYDPIIQNLQNDPKESSIEFSLRTDNHFHPGAK